MQVGDLVKHRFDECGVGVILELRESSHTRVASRKNANLVVQDRLALVHFAKEALPLLLRENYLELINASK